MELINAVFFFVLAIGVLVTFHEAGHFFVARWLGVKVLRFSVGFGKPLFRWRRAGDPTEYVVAAIPLGGYVKMLDEREAPVDEEELGRAFNRKPLATRIAVVAAGPIANLLLAVVLFWGMYLVGVEGLVPAIDTVSDDSPAAVAGLQSGDRIEAVNGHHTVTWDRVLQQIIGRSLDDDAIQLSIIDASGRQRVVELPAGALHVDDIGKGEFFERLGVTPLRPVLPARIGAVEAGSPAALGGLQAGDLVLKADDARIASWGDWVEHIRAHGGEPVQTLVARDGAELLLQVTPALVDDGEGGKMGRIGAGLAVSDELFADYYTTERLAPLPAAGQALAKTWEMSGLTLRMLWKMLTLEVSVKNLSGPISIAEYAGKSADIGLSRFLEFMAFVSVSLGVLNLLPIPILDGGHLMYYLIELLRRRPVSDAAQMQGQRVGIAVLMALMSLAIFNDLARVLGQ